MKLFTATIYSKVHSHRVPRVFPTRTIGLNSDHFASGHKGLGQSLLVSNEELKK